MKLPHVRPKEIPRTQHIRLALSAAEDGLFGDASESESQKSGQITPTRDGKTKQYQILAQKNPRAHRAHTLSSLSKGHDLSSEMLYARVRVALHWCIHNNSGRPYKSTELFVFADFATVPNCSGLWISKTPPIGFENF